MVVVVAAVLLLSERVQDRVILTERFYGRKAAEKDEFMDGNYCTIKIIHSWMWYFFAGKRQGMKFLFSCKTGRTKSVAMTDIWSRNSGKRHFIAYKEYRHQKWNQIANNLSLFSSQLLKPLRSMKNVPRGDLLHDCNRQLLRNIVGNVRKIPQSSTATSEWISIFAALVITFNCNS